MTNLEEFAAIASTCSIEECEDIIEDCKESNLELISGPVRAIYEARVKQLRDLQIEVEHYESKYDNES